MGDAGLSAVRSRSWISSEDGLSSRRGGMGGAGTTNLSDGYLGALVKIAHALVPRSTDAAKSPGTEQFNYARRST